MALLGAVLVALAAPSAAAGPAAPACDPVRPDERSASALASQCGKRVEVLAGRSETTQVFANPDGTSTFTSTAVPVRVHRADGSWVPVDTTLRVRPDGSIAPVATVTDMVFSGGGSGPFATYRDKGSTLTVGLPVTLPKPRLVGDTAIYPDVLPGIDLRVTASATNFRHVLVVKTAAAAAGLGDIGLVIGGSVRAAPAANGRVRFADAKGRTVALSEPATMWDSTVNPGEAGEVLTSTTREALDALRAHPPAELISDEHRPGITARSANVAVHADADGHGIHLTPDASVVANPVLPLFVDPSIGPPVAFWAYSMSGNYDYTMDGKAWVGLNPPAYGGDGSYFRGFFQFPTTYGGATYKSKHIISASFSIMLYHSWSCGPTVANAYSTLGIYVGNAGRMDFNARPLGAGATFIGSASGNANKAGGCGANQPNMLMTFGGGEAMRSDVQRVATGNGDAYAIGLCACDSNGANEGAQDRWKKFLVDGSTTMSVTYNTVPAVPDTLSPYQGQVACNGVVGTYSPVLQARYVDGDSTDTLSATFHWQQLPNGPVNSVAGPSKAAGNNGSVTLNLGSTAEGQQYQFQVQTFDGYDYSPWSPWCQFTVDTTAPAAPIIEPYSSPPAPLYPACDQNNVSACTPAGGPGIAGAFRFRVPSGTQSQDVVSYLYGVDSPTQQVNVSPGGQSAPVLITPTHYGLNQIVAKAVDGTGHAGPTTVFDIMVSAPSPEVAYWPLDSIDSHGLKNFGPDGGSLTAPAVTWTSDDRYMGAQAATFTGAGGAEQPLAPSSFSTLNSYSVAAWVRLSTTNWCSAGNAGIVAKNADTDPANNHVDAFLLKYDCTNHRWGFVEMDTNSTAANDNGAYSANGSAVPGLWTLLVGTFDKASNVTQLWVNGTLVSTATASAAWASAYGNGWEAKGVVAIGHYRWGDDSGGYVHADIADVRLWNRVLTTEDIIGTAANANLGIAEHDGLTKPREVGSWKFSDGECFCAQATDGSGFSRPVTVVPDWTVDPNWSGDPDTTPAWLSDESHDGDGGLRLDGVSGYASTADDAGTLASGDDVQHPVLRTDQSVTVAAWVKVNQITDTDQIVFHSGAVNLMQRGPNHTWAFTTQSPNGSGGLGNDEAWSDSPATANTWVYLLGEFDASTGTVRLWVNGVLQSHTSTGALGFFSTESLHIGSKSGVKMFGGVIDDVEVWQGLLNAREIAKQYATT
jgi:hypothetical protein